MPSTPFVTALLMAATLCPMPLAAPVVSSGRPVLVTISPKTDISDMDLLGEEQEFIERINGDRMERGLRVLTPDALLVQTARGHSQDMAARDYFGHYAQIAHRRTPMDRYVTALHTVGQAPPSYLLVGENIYYCSRFRGAREVALGHQALMDSPEHRANILDPRYAHIGVGVYRDTHGQIWVTEMFLSDSALTL